MPFTYEIDNNSWIKKATGSGEATIPSNVIHVSPDVFANTSVTSIIIPHTLFSFHINNCPNLKSITYLNNHLRSAIF